jgi:hypothetical protein
VGLEGTKGSMNSLAESLCTSKFLECHNDHDDKFHMD